MRIIFIGDVIAKAGRQALQQVAPRWRTDYGPDLVLANGENAAGGSGITQATAAELFAAGVDLLTLGNHAFGQREAITFLPSTDRVLRPLNYPPGTPGRGAVVMTVGPRRVPVMVANALGRQFMAPLDCPFRALDAALEGAGGLEERPRVIVVDFHAEATSEKRAIGFFLDGRVSLVVGTHTHVPTADAQVLPGGTAYVTDLGMAGPLHSVIGMEPGPVIARFTTGLHHRFTTSAQPPLVVNAILAEIDEQTGRALSIQRLDTVVEG